MSLRIDVHHPYAHDLILQAQDIVAARHPLIHDLRCKEVEGCGGINIAPELKLVEYDPVIVQGMAFDTLVIAMESAFSHYYLSIIPACAKTPLPLTNWVQ